ncbi:hypothetical protein, partial [Pseudomonas sp. WS 5071]|uniref:hypothetical protein n=1 Tax=Pseudomonas sp. WS 5071 TaxID=2717479 RepID=UPI001CB6E459
VTCSTGQLYAQVNSSTLQLSLTPPIYRFDKSAQATTSLTPGGGEGALRSRSKDREQARSYRAFKINHLFHV